MDEFSAVRLDGMTTAQVHCESGDYDADAADTAELSTVLGGAAMHAMTYGHVVHEHIDRDVTVRPVP